MESEILPIAAQLEKMAAGDSTMDNASELIAVLETTQISGDVLGKTRIGLILNDFRKKTADEKLAKRAKQLIKTWKSKVEATAKPARINSESRKKSSTTTPPVEIHEAKKPKLEPTMEAKTVPVVAVDIKPKQEASTSAKPSRLKLPQDPVSYLSFFYIIIIYHFRLVNAMLQSFLNRLHPVRCPMDHLMLIASQLKLKQLFSIFMVTVKSIPPHFAAAFSTYVIRRIQHYVRMSFLETYHLKNLLK